MNTTRVIASATAITTALLSAALLTPSAHAQTVVASSPTPPAVVAADVPADMVGITLIPGGVVVTGHGGDVVSVKAPRQSARSIEPANATTPARFTRLTPGITYAISVDGTQVATTTVLRAPASTRNLVVQTASDPGAVVMTWEYTPRAKTGEVSFRMLATPIPGQATTDVVRVDVPGTAREGVLSGLDPNTLYKFSIEAINAAASGTAVDAVMTQTLGVITGADARAQAAAAEAARRAADKAAADRAAAEAAAKRPDAAPKPAAVGGGGAPARPSTKTIYVCPDGFTDAGGTCTKSMGYTYQTRDYTYTRGKTGTEQIIATCSEWYVDPQGVKNYIVEPYECTITRDVFGDIKDATPAGWEDTGSNWRTKDAAPAGWSDDGSQWVQTTDKLAREVPA